MNPPLRHYPPFLRSLLTISLLIVCMVALFKLSFISIHSLFGVEKPENVVKGIFTGANDRLAFFFVQAFASPISFLITAVLFAALEWGKPIQALGLKEKPAVKFILLAIVAMVIAQLFVEFLVDVNSRIPLPDALNFLKEGQQKAVETTKAALDFTDVPTLLLATFVMAVLPAIGEEFFFRGLILGDLLKNGANPWAAVFVSGLFFALFHMQYDNTLAILVLGCFLSYLYYVTGSLWVPIAAHFVNNFFAVLLKYLFNTGVLSTDLAEASTPWYFTLASMLLFSGCVYLFYRWKKPVRFILTPIYNDTHQQPEQE